jgi:hypothetical protein
MMVTRGWEEGKRKVEKKRKIWGVFFFLDKASMSGLLNYYNKVRINSVWQEGRQVLLLEDCKELPNKDHTMCRKERFIEAQTAGLPLSGSECSSLAGMGRGLYRRGYTMREGGRSSQRTARPPVSIYLWSPDGMGQHSVWFCKQGNKQESFASGHKSGGSGFSASLWTLCLPQECQVPNKD